MANNGAGTQTSLDLESGLYRIGEVSRMTGVKAFVLRYWETEFPMLEPEKGSNGRRSYRQEDIELIRKINACFTTKDSRLRAPAGTCARAGDRLNRKRARRFRLATGQRSF